MRTTIALGLLLGAGAAIGQAPAHPFPVHTVYSANTIKPDNFTQSDLDDHTASFYDAWKAVFLKNDCGDPEQYHVLKNDTELTVSEGIGYGMMITVHMAGHDADARAYFDGLYRWAVAHPSVLTPHLMDWRQLTCSDDPTDDDNAASDGDIDIAFALLLADAQWGSGGTIDYFAEAQAMITAIMENEVHPATQTVMLGDWCDQDDPLYYNSTRTSDFIMDHFKLFGCVANDPDWNAVVDNCYALMEGMRTDYSPLTGLMPDFIVNVGAAPEPAAPDFLEDANDGAYFYNACRVPWRVGVDLLINGDERAWTTVTAINTWLIGATGGDVSTISNGYGLDGTPIEDELDASFLGPFTVGAMADPGNQEWLNDLYTELLTNNDVSDTAYFANTLKLLSMITISGNYWVPDCEGIGMDEDGNEESAMVSWTAGACGKLVLRVGPGTGPMGTIARISDLGGRMVASVVIDHDRQEIDVSVLPSGVYCVQLLQSERVLLTGKLLKE